MSFLTTPVPHKEAASFIAGKPAVAKEVFAELPAELKALAFTITGVEDLKVLQRARDIIAKLPLGGDYEDLKKDLVNTISPYMHSEKGALIRAELLLRLHGGQAYAAAQYRVMARQTDVFPYWQYLTFGDHRVRASHVALDKKIFRWDSPFWQLHYPPWEYLCRCRVAPLTRGQVEKIRAEDAKLPMVKRRLLEGPLLDKALTDHVLFSPADDGTTVNITPPSINDPEKGYRWHPGTIGVPMEKLKAGFDADLWQQFEDKAKATKISSQKTLWQGMEKLGQDYKPEPAKEVISPAKRAAILKALGMTEKDVAEHQKNQAVLETKRAAAAAREPLPEDKGPSRPAPHTWAAAVRRADELSATEADQMLGAFFGTPGQSFERGAFRATLARLLARAKGWKPAQESKASGRMFTDIAQVDAWFQKLGVQRVLTSSKGMKHNWGRTVSKSRQLYHAELLAREWERLLTDFPDFPRELHTLMLVQSDRGWGHLDGPTPHLATKMEEWSEAQWKNLSMTDSLAGHVSTTERKGRQVADNFRHELGHTVSTPSRRLAFLPLWQKYGPDGFTRHVSAYAAENEKEAFAELFGLVTREDYIPGSLPADLEAFVYSILKPTP